MIESTENENIPLSSLPIGCAASSRLSHLRSVWVWSFSWARRLSFCRCPITAKYPTHGALHYNPTSRTFIDLSSLGGIAIRCRSICNPKPNPQRRVRRLADLAVPMKLLLLVSAVVMIVEIGFALWVFITLLRQQSLFSGVASSSRFLCNLLARRR